MEEFLGINLGIQVLVIRVSLILLPLVTEDSAIADPEGFCTPTSNCSYTLKKKRRSNQARITIRTRRILP